MKNGHFVKRDLRELLSRFHSFGVVKGFAYHKKTRFTGRIKFGKESKMCPLCRSRGLNWGSRWTNELQLHANQSKTSFVFHFKPIWLPNQWLLTENHALAFCA